VTQNWYPQKAQVGCRSKRQAQSNHHKLAHHTTEGAVKHGKWCQKAWFETVRKLHLQEREALNIQDK